LRAQLEFAGGEACWFDPLRPASIAAAVRELFGRYDHYCAASRQAGRTLAGRTWTDTAADYAEVLRWCAGRRDGPIPQSPFAANRSTT
jgi:hypothetical protein